MFALISYPLTTASIVDRSSLDPTTNFRTSFDLNRGRFNLFILSSILDEGHL